MKNKTAKATAPQITPTQSDFDFWSQHRHTVNTYGLLVTFGDSRTDRNRYRKIQSQITTWAGSMSSRSFNKLGLQVTHLKGKLPTIDQLHYTIFNPPA